MKYIIIIFFLLSACTQNYTKQNINNFDFLDNITIEEFRIKNAPVLAQIISSASIIGLLDNLNGNGLLFTKIEGAFVYKENRN